jgi:uncharacterized membrane protein SpoIIM required for sporulation
MSGIQLKSYQFRKEREDSWRELEQLLATVDRRGLRALNATELVRLPNLYRAALATLSVARDISLDRDLLDYLDSLCVRAYFVVYGSKSTILDTLVSFFVRQFPSTVRKFRWHLALATLFMALGGLTSFYLTQYDPENYYTFIPEELAQERTPAASTESLRETLFAGEEHEEGELASFSSFLFTHNSGVGILCFAVSFVPILLVFLLMFYNGLMLGAMTALFHSRDLAWEWWSWILPHGVTELLAVLLCGGAGLVVGQSILFPGDRTRMQSLARQGREAAFMVLGAVTLFFIAALIEGIFRQRVQDLTVRYSVALFTALVWILYFGFAGRRFTGWRS